VARADEVGEQPRVLVVGMRRHVEHAPGPAQSVQRVRERACVHRGREGQDQGEGGDVDQETSRVAAARTAR